MLSKNPYLSEHVHTCIYACFVISARVQTGAGGICEGSDRMVVHRLL